jgi:hypothetical protein
MKHKKSNKEWQIKGIRLPLVYDPVSHKPSITILFAYFTFAIAFGSVLCLHFFSSLLAATTISIIFWAISVIFYMIRKINKASIDIKNKSISLENQSSGDDKPSDSE